MEKDGPSADRLLGPEESAFIAERDSFYIATVGATGWPYVAPETVEVHVLVAADVGAHLHAVPAARHRCTPAPLEDIRNVKERNRTPVADAAVACARDDSGQ